MQVSERTIGEERQPIVDIFGGLIEISIDDLRRVFGRNSKKELISFLRWKLDDILWEGDRLELFHVGVQIVHMFLIFLKTM